MVIFGKEIYNTAVNSIILQFYNSNLQKLTIFKKGICFIIAIFALY